MMCDECELSEGVCTCRFLFLHLLQHVLYFSLCWVAPERPDDCPHLPVHTHTHTHTHTLFLSLSLSPSLSPSHIYTHTHTHTHTHNVTQPTRTERHLTSIVPFRSWSKMPNASFTLVCSSATSGSVTGCGSPASAAIFIDRYPIATVTHICACAKPILG